jgi:hypothetical protein
MRCARDTCSPSHEETGEDEWRAWALTRRQAGDRERNTIAHWLTRSRIRARDGDSMRLPKTTSGAPTRPTRSAAIALELCHSLGEVRAAVALVE